MSVNQKDEFWDRIEIKDTIQISEKDRVTINIAEKNSKRFLFLQKEFVKKDEWCRGKGFTIDLDKNSKAVFESALKILSEA